MNTSIAIPSSDETVSATTSLPELSDLNSSSSTFRSNSSISSLESGSNEEASSTPDSQQESNGNRSATGTSRTSSHTIPSTSISQRSIHTRRSRRRQSNTRRRYSTSVLVLNKLLQFSFSIVMNAAITIFGVGIGVGIILADSFRSQATTNSTNHNNLSATTSARAGDLQRGNEHATIPVSAATPTCRATFRRAIDRIQEAPPINIAAISALPAQ